MLSDNTITAVITGLLGSGVGGAIGWLVKAGPERTRITIGAAEGAVVVQSGVIENLKKEITRLNYNQTQMEMDIQAREKEFDSCAAELAELKLTQTYLRRDLDRHGRMNEIARRRSHILANTVQAFELLVDQLMDEMRKNNIAIPAELRPQRIRKSLSDELDKLADLERQVTYSAVANPVEQTEGEQ